MSQSFGSKSSEKQRKTKSKKKSNDEESPRVTIENKVPHNSEISSSECSFSATKKQLENDSSVKLMKGKHYEPDGPLFYEPPRDSKVEETSPEKPDVNITQKKTKSKSPSKECKCTCFHGNVENKPLITPKDSLFNHHMNAIKKNDKIITLDKHGYGKITAEDWSKVTPPPKPNLMEELYRLIQNHVNTDTMIHIGDESFHCHHLVLDIYSKYFIEHPEKEIELARKKISPETFHLVYKWMVFDTAMNIFTSENILDLYSAAKYLEIPSLENQCWAYIADEELFTEDTAFTVYREAVKNKLPFVANMMVSRIRKIMLPLIASKDFLNLSLEEVTALLKSNHICVTSETEVFMSALHWLIADWTKRIKHVEDVMKCVRFGLIPPGQLMDFKKNADNHEVFAIVNMPSVLHMVDDGLAYVIIKYWYNKNPETYHHWIHALDLKEPAERNWIGTDNDNIKTYKDFLEHIEQYSIPNDQFHRMIESLKDEEDANKVEVVKEVADTSETKPNKRSSAEKKDRKRNSLDPLTREVKHELLSQPNIASKICNIKERVQKKMHKAEDSDDTTDEGSQPHKFERRRSAAAKYLASATALLNRHSTFNYLVGSRGGSLESGYDVKSQSMMPDADSYLSRESKYMEPRLINGTEMTGSPVSMMRTPQISLFEEGKHAIARAQMNRLSLSVLGPTSKNYLIDGSLFNWDRETVLVFGGVDPHANYGVGRNSGKEIYKFEPISNVWEIVGELPEPRHHHSVAFLRGRVYLVGGADPREDDIRGKSVVVSTVWSYEPVSRSWFSESGLATPRKNFGLVVHRKALYAIGGLDKNGRVLRSVERFDPTSGFWSEVKDMAVARMATATTKYRDYIWVAGGMTGERRKPLCDIVECYNSNNNQWTRIYNLRCPRSFASFFVMNDILYLVGGAGKIFKKEKTASSIGAVDYWDWESRTWKQISDMSIPRHGHAIAYLGTQMIIIGGVTTIYMRALSNVESYCCERKAWIRGIAPLPTPLSGHGAVTLPPASLMA